MLEKININFFNEDGNINVHKTKYDKRLIIIALCCENYPCLHFWRNQPYPKFIQFTGLLLEGLVWLE